MKRLVPIYLVALVMLGGCNSAKQSREIIIVADVSASIDAQARRQMFDAIKQVAEHLHRGDTLTVMPITGDAEADLQGRILRYQIPTAEKRQAYDADLRKVSSRAANDLKYLEVWALAHPSQYSDILGTVRIAISEFSTVEGDKQLIVLSDFLQDGQRRHFTEDRQLATGDLGKQFGAEMKKGGDYHSPGWVLLGRMRSPEYAGLTPDRQDGVDAFWQTLMSVTTIHSDGPTSLLRQVPVE